MTVRLPPQPAAPVSARDELAALTRERVLRGAEELLTSGREVTFSEVARASGVPERTVYRYFPTKDALLAAFWEWLNHAELGLAQPGPSLDEVLAQVPRAFAAFERRERLVRAMLHDPQGRSIRHANAATRRRELQRALRDALARVEPRRRVHLLALVRLLSSASAWETMKDAGNLSGPEAGAAAQWAIRALVASATAAPRAKRSGTNAKPRKR